MQRDFKYEGTGVVGRPPENLIGKLPETWTPEEMLEFELWLDWVYDALAGRPESEGPEQGTDRSSP